MSHRIDLTGKRFGALVALRPVPSSETRDRRPGWLVRCDCGEEKVVNADNLRSGRITSCGCGLERGRRVSVALRGKGPVEDLTGQTLGHLTAVEYLGHNIWRWQCDCGRETTAKAADVKAGVIQSCGHVLAEAARKKIIVDNTVQHYDGTTVSRLRRIMSSTETRGIRERVDAKGLVYYQARIMLRGRSIHLGTFYSRAEAEMTRRRAEEKYYLPIIEAYDSEAKDDG